MSNRNFDEFTKAYLETALWSSSDNDDKPLDEYNSTDIADETINENVDPQLNSYLGELQRY